MKISLQLNELIFVEGMFSVGRCSGVGGQDKFMPDHHFFSIVPRAFQGKLLGEKDFTLKSF